MAPSSLPKKARSLSSSKPVVPSSSTSSPPSTLLAKITSLSHSLPPIAPHNAILNPLADLITLFSSLPLSLSSSTTPPTDLELNRQAVHTSLHSIKACFEALISQGRLHGVLKGKKQKIGGAGGGNGEGKGESDDAVQKVKQWLQGQWNDYLAAAAKVVGGHWDTGVRLSALTALLSLLRTESTFLTSLHHSRQAQFPSTTFSHIVKAIVSPPTEDGLLRDDVKEEWIKWWNRCDDVRFHFLKESAVYLSSFSSTSSSSSSAIATPLPPNLLSNYITLLESLTTMPTASSELNEWWCSTPIALKPSLISSNKKRKLPSSSSGPSDGSTGVFDSSSEEEDSDSNAPTKLSSRESKKLLPPLLSLSAHKKVFQDCVLALLGLPLEEGESKRLLVMLHRQVLPNLTDPKRLMDWLTDCAEHGGTVGILALNGLFTLMQKHNLEFPDFFSKLYSLLDRDVLHVRYRPRFFRLLVVFMGSSHLPSTLVASFIKRLARLSLSAPPAAIVTVVPFIYNLLKLHPACMVMIHRPTSDDEDEREAHAKDPFLPLVTDPLHTNALSSSLWELSTLQNHYLAAVSGLAKIFTEVMGKQSYDMEDFLDHSYGTMFATESERVIRKAPALAPVPKRQPIGDSFFPKPKSVVVVEGEVVGEEEEEKVELEDVDLVSSLWSF